MSRGALLVAAVGLGALLSGCSTATTRYDGRVVAPGELVLRYKDGYEMWSAGRPVARGLHYEGLPEFVRCVPRAHEHAQAARDDGSTATTLSILGGTFAVVGLGGLAGLAFKDTNEPAMYGLLIGGVATEVVGLILAGVGRGHKVSANGHAIDAMNYYNDAVGSLGGSCSQPGVPSPAGPSPAGPSPDAAPPDAAPPDAAPPDAAPPDAAPPDAAPPDAAP